MIIEKNLAIIAYYTSTPEKSKVFSKSIIQILSNKEEKKFK
jgi:hypothetical protein